MIRARFAGDQGGVRCGGAPREERRGGGSYSFPRLFTRRGEKGAGWWVIISRSQAAHHLIKITLL